MPVFSFIKSNGKAKMLIIVILVLLLIGAYWGLKYLHDTSYAKVLGAIHIEHAMKMVDENENYYLVEAQNGATGAEFAIVYGAYEGSDIELTSSAPGIQLSNIFFLSKENKFLIKSTGKEENADNLGKSFDVAFPDIYTVEVENWAIVAPIRRDYQYRTKKQATRLFSPSGYIDAFDVKNGDYNPQ